MKTNKRTKSDKTSPEQLIYRRFIKSRKEIKDLFLKNLLRTNEQLLKSLDVSTSVLF